MALNPYQQYRSSQLDTVGPGEIIVLAYEGALRFTNQARVALEREQLDQASQLTGKAQAILIELAANLNFEAGEVAVNLARMYEYWTWRLSQGLLKRDPAMYQEVAGQLAEFAEAWAEVNRQARMARGAARIG